MYLFLDSEFVPSSEVSGPQLLSIGLCTLGRAEFYRELMPVADASVADDFLREHVLPQLSGVQGVRGEAPSVAADLAAWLDALGEPVLQICYDYHVDYDLFEQLLYQESVPVSTKLLAVHVGYLLGDDEAEQAAKSCWSDLSEKRGLRRHHALADALALRARFEQVHGR